MNVAWALNTAWMWKCRRETCRFVRDSNCVESTQHKLLKRIVRDNVGTDFGIQHRFDKVGTAKEFQSLVPIGDYESHAGRIDRIAGGEGNVLTAESVRLLEPTSGTTKGEKLIPYTVGLRNDFQRAIATWIGDLFFHYPKVRDGRAYWSISPAMGPKRYSAAGIPIGFDEDTAYLSSWERRFVQKLLVTAPSVAKSTDIQAFRYQTLLHLLAAKDLALISIWSPTFLTGLFSPLDSCLDRLLTDLRQGTNNLRSHPRRADELQEIFSYRVPLADKLRLAWPRLALLSCWADASSRSMLPEVRSLLGHADFQPKGLISTEAFVTIPLFGQSGAALAIRTHFFEFKEVDSPRCRFAHELDVGGRYQVVVTTSGGLYRYQLFDEMTVSGFLHGCPLLRFVGRSNQLSDLVGEKLNESHVQAVVDRVLSGLQIVPAFAMLVPVMAATPHYRLYLQSRESAVDGMRVAKLLERGLQENPHYQLAVALEQLAAVDVRTPRSNQSFWAIYERRRIAEGAKLGDIKPAILDPWQGWDELFTPSHSTDPRPWDASRPAGQVR